MSDRMRDQLVYLARRRKRVRATLAAIDAELENAVIAADSYLTRSDIVRLSGLTRETIYRWLSPAYAEKSNRRKRNYRRERE